jgi:hypothetical protein
VSKVTELSAYVENVILLQYGEMGGRFIRSLSIMKVRDSGFEAHPVILNIASSGLSIETPSLPLQLPFFTTPVSHAGLIEVGKR